MYVITEGIGPRSLVTAGVGLLVAGIACASVPAESARLATVAMAAVQVSEPATIGSVTLDNLGDGGEEVRIESDGVLVWTQYRDDAGNLIVELPNTNLGEGVGGLVSDGLVLGVEVETFAAAERPLTRFIFRTAGSTEHSLTLDGTALSLQFVPMTVTADDSGSSVAPQGTPSEEAGTPQNPRRGPPPRGVAATRLEGVEALASASDGIRIVGDGEFSYSTFWLQDPPRFVVDLEGVVNTADTSTIYADTRYVDQVRTGQFRPYPDPVTRVVLDLREASTPILEPSADGLLIRFEPAAPTSPSLLVETNELIAEVAPEPDPELAALEPAEIEPEQPGSPEPVDSPVSESEVVFETDPAVAAFPQTEDSEVDDAVDQTVEIVDQTVEAADDTVEGADPAEVLETSFDEETEPVQVAEDASPSFPVAEEPMTETELEVSAEQLQVAELEDEPLAFEQPPEPEEEPEEQPLQIQDESAREVPWQPEQPSEVTLYEAQQVTIDGGGNQTSGAAAPFGVREIGEQTRYSGDPISMSLKDSDVTEVLRSIARLADLNIVIQPGVTGPVTVELDRVPWDQALEQILKVNNLGQQLEGNILRIAPVAQLELEARQLQTLEQAKALSVPLATIMRRISYATADDIARILTRGQRTQSTSGSGGFAGATQTGILSQRGSVSVDQRTNTLIIRELPSYLNSVIQIIENLDVPEKQVMIEARIVETTRNFSRSLGINWSFDGIADNAHGNTTGLVFPNNASVDGGVNLVTGGNNGFINLGLGNVLNTFQLDVALNAAEADGLVNVISAPKVAVLNNEEASIQSGLQIPVQTIANNTVTVQFVNATLRLDVTPHVTAEGTIMMTINIQKREPQLAFAVVGASNAPIATREAQTRVIVRDGGTAVIGGIYEVSSNDGSDKVPGLANIPLIGHLFKNRNRSNQNEELLIFITPRVIQL